ncbi:MAG: glycosyltransferase family A protein [Candidatus Babeliales bacterium]
MHLLFIQREKIRKFECSVTGILLIVGLLSIFSSKTVETNFNSCLKKAYYTALQYQSLQPDTMLPEKKIIVLIPSYNNARWYQHNLESVFSQQYKNYSIIYIDDCSSDATGKLVESYIKTHPNGDCVTFIKNGQRNYAMANIYRVIHEYCDDDAIIIMLDGDDFLAHDRVLKYINYIYCVYDIWMSYGNYLSLQSLKPFERTKPFAPSIISNNGFRQSPLGVQHLRTFYAWLFKKIDSNDLKYEGKFLTMTSDVAMYTPMIEMAANHHLCVRDVLYIYNDFNPINDHKKNKQYQIMLDVYIRNKSKYLPFVL